MDQAQVAELCDTEQEEVTLYAIWDYSNQKITNIPTRQGYQFAGWSQDPDAQQGNTTFSMERGYGSVCSMESLQCTLSYRIL